jgi:hypothetical protein
VSWKVNKVTIGVFLLFRNNPVFHYFTLLRKFFADNSFLNMQSSALSSKAKRKETRFAGKPSCGPCKKCVVELPLFSSLAL